MILQIIKYKLILDIQPVFQYKICLFMPTAQYKTKGDEVKRPCSQFEMA